MRIEWTTALSTNVPEIDEQHKELIIRINGLLDACSGNTTRDTGSVIAFLEEYVVSHFGCEEQLMLAAHYPAYAQHREEHAIFIERIADVKHKFQSEGAGPDLLHLAARTLIEWLDVHIRHTDRKLGDYLGTLKSGRA